jgi:cytochrome c5
MKSSVNTGRAPLCLLAGALLVVAGTAAFAQFQSGSYSATKAGSLEQTVCAPTSSDGNYSVSSFASVAPKLAEGEGRAETESFCAMCHSTRYITMQPPLPGATWEAEVNKMIKTFGAPIPEASAKKIVSYLQTHYTPETRKQ